MGKFVVSVRNDAGELLEIINFADVDTAIQAFDMLSEDMTFVGERLIATLSYKTMNLPTMHLAHRSLKSSDE